MYQASRIELGRLAQDLQLKRKQVETVVELLDAENTVPFITRFRKEQTGNLNEEQIRAIQRRVQQLRQLAERRDTILRSLEVQNKLTDSLREAIESASSMKRLEDLYLPFKPKKQTLATIARDRGLGPLAEAIWSKDEAVANLEEILQGMLDAEKQLNTPEDVLTGVQHILAERIAEDAEVRAAARSVLWAGRIHTSKSPSIPEASGDANAEPHDARQAEFRNYFDYSEAIGQIPPHRILAINRGERLGILKVRQEFDRSQLNQAVEQALSLADHPHAEFLKKCAADAIERLLLRSLEREIRTELSERAEQHAVEVFARNLRNLLLQPPVPNHRVLAIDPGYRSGCKIAVLDEFGNLLNQDIIFPHSRRKKKKKKKRKVEAQRQPEQKVGSKAAAEAKPAEPAPPSEPASDEDPPPILPADSFYRSIPPDDAEERSVEPVSESTSEPNAAVGEVPTASQADPPEGEPAGDGEAAVAAEREVASSDAQPVEAQTASDDAEPTLQVYSEVVTREDDAVAESAVTQFEIGSAEPAEAEAEIVAPEPAGDEVLQATAVEVVVPESQQVEDAAEPQVAFEAKPKSPPAEPQKSKRQIAKETIQKLCQMHKVDVIAIGNGTGCRETEEFIAELLETSDLDIPYVIVNESGASVYSTSPVGREEFPEYDPALRGTISIGRRLQDPLSELVKIDPQNIGVGLYQHDVNPRRLKESLAEVVESCVNFVGVDVNTASVQLLQNVSGLNQLRARNLIEYRKEHGPFTSREQLQQVPGIGPAVFTQAAGFLKTTGGDQPFDATWIHPESYLTAAKVLELIGDEPSSLLDRTRMEALRAKLNAVNEAELAEKIGVGEQTIRDILENLARPGRDPREDLPKPIFRKGILRLEDLTEGMQLQGTVLNVVDFGAFVDVGLKDSCLVHISELANRFIRSPHDVVAVGDIVTTWVLNVDAERRRVSLTMIPPGTQRAQQSHRGRPPRQQQRAAAPAGRPQQQQGPASTEGQQQRAAAPLQQRPVQRREPLAPKSAKKRKKAVKVQHRRNPAPTPKLSSEALEGKTALHTFGELKAFFDHKQRKKSDDQADPSKK